jgi:hypothetical protein
LGVKALLLAAALAVTMVAPAAAQRTTFSALSQCSRYAAVQFKRHDPGFRRFVIERASVTEDRFSDRVGNQFVSTIYRGKATYEGPAGPRLVRFICLHGGIGRGAVFVYMLSD